ncbi:cytochrome c551 [Microbacteriaceae bacterium 4G12]
MKKKLLVVMVGAALTLSMGACGKKEEASPSKSQTASGGDAEKIFQQSCASCHGNNLQGQIGPALTKVGGKFSEGEIEKIIADGRGSMPKGVIQGDDAKAVAKWLSEKK